MTIPLVECIPNFSEARSPEVVEAIVEAVKSVPAVTLLDQHSDHDHNRTVLTFVGPPVDVEEATYRAISTAAELINLDEHEGEHPRIGAAVQSPCLLAQTLLIGGIVLLVPFVHSTCWPGCEHGPFRRLSRAVPNGAVAARAR